MTKLLPLSALFLIVSFLLVISRRGFLSSCVRHFSEEGHHGFLENIRVTIIDKLLGDRIRENFWQHKLDTFTPLGFNGREVDV